MSEILKNKIAYIYSDDLVTHCDKLPAMKNRASIVHDLVRNYNLLSQENIVVVKPRDATEDELKSFHSSDYIDLLKSLNSFDTSLDNIEDNHLEFGLGYDNVIIENVFDFASCLVGSSVSAARLLAAKKCKTVINWFGGWHHAQRDSAAGFCYVNDIVIAIQIMSKFFDKIIYVDLDIHHGDGVQNAFEYSSKILTLSFHKYSQGFFPNTGNIDDIGQSQGKYYTMNIPLKDGVCDKTYVDIFNEVFSMVIENFKAEALVVQCGGDGLIEDPLGQCNLTLKGLGECINKILKSDLPTLFLGGGGYNFPNTARLWAYLTSLILKTDLSNDIPDT
ncbi:histone deacetylase 8-like isoform X2 [Sitophilus oryzae]|nr:histone deacetylase 8-like isoform X2 [Sitophilus oryzae]